MIFESVVHGKIEYEEKDILTFERGILGFNDLRKFILVDLKGYEPFKLLHSLENNEIGMILTSPYEFFEDYKIKLNDETIEHLKLISSQEVLVYTTVTLNSDPKKVTTNLQGPIIINERKKLAEQIIVDNTKYKIKVPLMKE